MNRASWDISFITTRSLESNSIAKRNTIITHGSIESSLKLPEAYCAAGDLRRCGWHKWPLVKPAHGGPAQTSQTLANDVTCTFSHRLGKSEEPACKFESTAEHSMDIDHYLHTQTQRAQPRVQVSKQGTVEWKG